MNKEATCKRIKEIFDQSKETYGSPRIFETLRDENFSISENTVAKYMRELGLDARLKKKYRVQTTDSNHSDPIAPRIFKVEDDQHLPLKPELLAGDITYLSLEKAFTSRLSLIFLIERFLVGRWEEVWKQNLFLIHLIWR